MDLAQCTICQDFFEFKKNDIVAGICILFSHEIHNYFEELLHMVPGEMALLIVPSLLLPP